MSSPNLRLALTPAARDDFEDILLYTLQEWGPEQRERYGMLLERGFALLVQHPGLGRVHDDLPTECRAYRVEQHIVVYDVRGQTLRVLRILHVRQDIKRAMQDVR